MLSEDRMKQECNTNWNNLPMEMKEICYGFMDNKTRNMLGSTCRAERDILPLKRIDVNLLVVDIDYPDEVVHRRQLRTAANIKVTVKFANGKTKTEATCVKRKNEYRKNAWREVPLLQQVLTFGKIKVFFWQNNTPNAILPFFKLVCRGCPSFHIENVWLESDNRSTHEFILRKCAEKVKLQKFCIKSCKNMRALMKSPKLKNTKYIQSYLNQDIDFQVIEMLIKNDAEIGTRFIAEKLVQHNLDRFKTEFKDRFIEFSEQRILMRTDNDEKQILIRPADDYEYSVAEVVDSKNPQPSEDFSRWDILDDFYVI